MMVLLNDQYTCSKGKRLQFHNMATDETLSGSGEINFLPLTKILKISSEFANNQL